MLTFLNSGIFFNDIKDAKSFFGLKLNAHDEYSCILFLSRLGKLMVGRNHGVNVFSVENRHVE
jgi:hypothetical protein